MEGMRVYPFRRFESSPGVVLLVTLAVGFTAPDSAFGGEDTTPPELNRLALHPASIHTSKGAAEVTIAFTITDDASEANYFEAAFLDPSGDGRQYASCRKVQKLAWVRQSVNSLRTNPSHASPRARTVSTKTKENHYL
jgi:hypothetical protein